MLPAGEIVDSALAFYRQKPVRDGIFFATITRRDMQIKSQPILICIKGLQSRWLEFFFPNEKTFSNGNKLSIGQGFLLKTVKPLLFHCEM